MSSAKDDKFAAKEPPFLSELPQVSAEDAATLREQISQRTFVPSNTRPPEEVLPNPDFITIIASLCSSSEPLRISSRT